METGLFSNEIHVNTNLLSTSSSQMYHNTADRWPVFKGVTSIQKR